MEIAQESKSNALLMWVLAIFFGFIPPLIFFFVKKEDSFVYECSKEALNLTLNLMIICFGGMILSIILAFIPVIGVIAVIIIYIAIMVAAVACLIFCILGAISANKGEAYKVPFIIRLVK